DDPMEMIMGGVKIKDIMEQHDVRFSEFAPYIPLSEEDFKSNKTSVLYLGYFERWDPQECYYYAVENTGFDAAHERSDGTYSKYTEIDDKMVPFHFYTTHAKFGIGRATYDASQEIRNGKIEREEGVALVERYDAEFPKTFFPDVLDYLDLSEREFHEAVDRFRSPHLWKNVAGKWLLRHSVAGTGCED
ncbi:MAG: hypothetical protein Q9M30_04910, partial [Mariprofundaceae bacterium]|nr:hypothetical protein [Mariprofundaceae bacterium]